MISSLRRHIHLILLSFLCLVAPAGAVDVDSYRWISGVSPKPQPAGDLTDRNDLEDFVDGVMAAQFEALNLAGAVVTIVRNGEVLFSRGYGYEDWERRVPVDPDLTLFRPGSISKLFTWTAVMQLEEQGKLDLDVDVNQYVTQFQIPDTYREPVTLRHIMTHSAGFEDGSLGFLFRFDEADLMPLADALARHVPARVRPPSRDFNNGAAVAYSNWATALAGLIVANVSGMSFEDYVEEHIFRPLGMNRSTFREPLRGDFKERMAGGYTFRSGDMHRGPFELVSNFGPAGALSATGADMAKFMIEYLDKSGLVLRPETIDRMHARALSPEPHLNGMALGFYETHINGWRTIGHGGSTLYFKSDLMLIPDEGLGVFLSYNAADGGLAHAAFKRAFMDRYFPAERPDLTAPEDFATRAGDYAGTYRELRRSHSTVEKLMVGIKEVKVTPMPDQTLMISGLLGRTDRWVEVGQDLFRQKYGEDLVAFKRDEDGAVSHLLPSFVVVPLERVGAWESGMAHGLFVLLSVPVFISMLVVAWYRRRGDAKQDGHFRRTSCMLVIASVLNILFVIGVVVSFMRDVAELMDGYPGVLKLSLALPILSLVVTVAAASFSVLSWVRGQGTVGWRIYHAMIIAMSFLFLWVAAYWNLLGYRLG